MTVRAADERAHPPPVAAPGWWETWHLDVATDDGAGLSVRLALAPALGVAWWWTHLILPDLPGPIVVRDHEVGLPRQGLEIRADGLWGELVCESPLEHWTYGLEAFGVKLDDPADSLHGEIGERMPVGFDLEWESAPDAAVPYEYRAGAVAGYEQFGVVHGEVLLARSRLELDGVARRSHWWGVPRVDRPAHALWLRAPELAISLASDDAVDGLVVRGGISETVATVRRETRRRADGLPVAARDVVDDRIEIEVDILGLVAVPLVGPGGERAVLARGLCRYDVVTASADPNAIGDQSPIGWSSWLDPE